MHKSGLELCRLLKYNFDRASAFNVSAHESIEERARCDVETRRLERRRQEYYREAVASKKPELVKMKTHRISGYPVFEQADLVKVLPGSIVKELKKRTNIDFEKD